MDLVSKANRYNTGLRRAWREGFARGYGGSALEPCPWSRGDYVTRYEEGWRLGARKRAEQQRGH